MRHCLLALALLTTLFVSEGFCICSFVFYFGKSDNAVVSNLDQIADPAFGSFRSCNNYKNEALRYYDNDPCEDTEPPSADPTVYDWPSSDIPNSNTPNGMQYWPYIDCTHRTNPPPPGVKGSSGLIREYDLSIVTPFRLRAFGFIEQAEAMKNTPDPLLYTYTIRNNNIDNPGNYFMLPFYFHEIPVDSEDVVFLDNILSKYLALEYYSVSIVDSIQNIYLKDLNRREFFFESTLNNTRFRFSGWYGKFAHIFVFTDSKTKEGLIEEAKRYFNLPVLDIKHVSYAEDDFDVKNPDFFYDYMEKDINFKLVAYPNLQYDFELKEDYYKDVILDLTVYPEEQ